MIAEPQEKSGGTVFTRENILSLIFWYILIGLFFRPIIWGDIQNLQAAGGLANARPVLLNFGSDLLCLGIVVAVLTYILITQIGSIAYNTFREAVRNRILYFILFFALVLMGASGVIKELAIAAHQRIVMDLGLTCISFFGLMVAVFVGISLVYNEIEKRTIYTIVSKPIKRSHFLLGKYFGLLLTVLIIVGIMTLFFFTVMNYHQATTDEKIQDALYQVNERGIPIPVEDYGWLKTRFLANAVGTSIVQGCGNMLGFTTPAVSQSVMVAVVMIFLTLIVVTAFAILFSSFSTPTLSAVLTVMVFLAGRLNEDIMRFAMTIAENAMKQYGVTTTADLPFLPQLKMMLAEASALIVPNLDSLNVVSQALYNEQIQVWRYSVLYAILYTGGVLMVSILVFRKRNFK